MDTLGLMFEIAADPSKGIEATQRFAQNITASFNQLTAELEQVKGQLAAAQTQIEEMGEAPVRLGTASRNASLAVRGLGEEVGIHMPRFISTFLSQVEGVGPMITSAFSTIAVFR